MEEWPCAARVSFILDLEAVNLVEKKLIAADRKPDRFGRDPGMSVGLTEAYREVRRVVGDFRIRLVMRK